MNASVDQVLRHVIEEQRLLKHWTFIQRPSGRRTAPCSTLGWARSYTALQRRRGAHSRHPLDPGTTPEGATLSSPWLQGNPCGVGSSPWALLPCRLGHSLLRGLHTYSMSSTPASIH